MAHPDLALSAPEARLDCPGFSLFNLSAPQMEGEFVRLCTDSGSQGAIIGPIFRQAGRKQLSGPVLSISTDCAQRIFRSSGESLMSDYWGSYIAFLKSADSALVITDPTSALPCFYTRHEGVTLAFSHLEKCPFIDKLSLTLNEGFVSELLINDKIQTGETGLNEVSELAGGRRLTIVRDGVTSDLLWDPAGIARERYEPAEPAAVSDLRDTVSSVVSARVSQFRKVTVSLSGGLDSAIVLASAAKALGVEVNALHQFSDAGDPPELRYAKDAADAVGCELRPVQISADRRLPEPMTHKLTARPQRTFVSPEIADLISDDRDYLGEAFFTGEGGDHLLHNSRTPLVFADHLFNHGITRATLHQLLCSARLSEHSAWQVASQALPYLFRNGGSRLSSEDLPAAKSAQVRRLSHLIHVRDILDNAQGRRIVHPLISQPLVELCLRLPTYLLSLNGVSRGLAREAFRGTIPESIRTRMSKGKATRHAIQLIRANRFSIGEALLDGELVRRGLLQTSVIEDFLREDSFRFRELGRRMLVYYAIEAWLSRWTGYLKAHRNLG